MTLGEYIKQQPETTFSIEYYFESYCRVCHENFLNLDEEYSFDLVASDIGKTGYDWIFEVFDTDDSRVEINGTTITITVDDPEPYVCDECEKRENEEYFDEVED